MFSPCPPENLRKPFKEDTLEELFESENINLYKEWLRNQGLLYYENIACEKGNKIYLMTHAGIPPHWSWQEALEASQEIEVALKDDDLYREYLSNIYGNLQKFIEIYVFFENAQNEPPGSHFGEFLGRSKKIFKMSLLRAILVGSRASANCVIF